LLPLSKISEFFSAITTYFSNSGGQCHKNFFAGEIEKYASVFNPAVFLNDFNERNFILIEL
jgi:hypothetical protein